MIISVLTTTSFWTWTCFQELRKYLQQSMPLNYIQKPPPPKPVVRKCSVKKVFLKKLEKFTGKHFCQNLLFTTATLLKNWLRHKSYPLNYEKFLRAPLIHIIQVKCFYFSWNLIGFPQIRFQNALFAWFLIIFCFLLKYSKARNTKFF